MTRRDFLVKSSALALQLPCAGVAAHGFSCSRSGDVAGSKKTEAPLKKRGKSSAPTRESLVVCSKDIKVFGAKGHDDARVQQMVFRAVARVADVKKPDEAFRALFNPKDVVAIKVNCLAGPGLSSSTSVVKAIVTGLHSIGIPHKNIIIWERTTGELEEAGFESNRYSDSRPLCFGNEVGGFEQRIELSGEVGSLWSNILARKATALINVPVLKDHDLSGVGCGMKNMYGAIHNPNRYHDNNCDPYVADVSAHRYIKDKLRLVVADALTAQYHGGPAKVVAHQWRPAEVFMSTDPVALDAYAHTRIDKERSKHGMASLLEAKRPPRWITTAAEKGLGENRMEKIRIMGE